MKNTTKEYKISYISLDYHEIILNRTKNKLIKEINNYSEKMNLTNFKKLEESHFTDLDSNINRNYRQKNAFVRLNFTEFH